jgi:SAM-dependent methyltransferase
MGFREKIWADGMKRYEECIYQMVAGEQCVKILDLGCGDGIFTKKIASKLGCADAVGVESHIEKAKKAEGIDIKVFISDLNQTFPFDDCSFDIVLSNFVIEHIFDVDKFVTEIKRVLKIGGCAIIGTENLAGAHNFLALLLGMQPFPMSVALSSKFRIGNRLQAKNLLPIEKDESPHIRVFAYEGLKDIFKVYSFHAEKICGAGYPPFAGRIGDFLAKIDPRHAAFNIIKVRKILK